MSQSHEAFESAFQRLKTRTAKPNVLENPDETTDVILEVQGRELYANRAVLAHYSPVFRRMFFSDFKEKSEARVPFPRKRYDDMVLFFNTLLPRAPDSPSQINDENLLLLLALADEYRANEVKSRCQDYIGEQFCLYSHRSETYELRQASTGMGLISNEERINKLTFYLLGSVRHNLPKYREKLSSQVIQLCQSPEDLENSDRYRDLPDAAKVSLLQLMCKKMHDKELQAVAQRRKRFAHLRR